MADQLKKCPACSGRGYFRCDCWPGDCICDEGDENCFECGGDGFIEPDDEQGCYYPEDGNKLNSMAWSIANDLPFVQKIAKGALEHEPPSPRMREVG